MRTVVGTFNSKEEAEMAVNRLREAGYDQEISIISNPEGHSARLEQGSSMASGAATGGIVGGLAGLALGASAIAVPGIGPLLAAGPITALLTGASAGGLLGGLGSWGVTSNQGRKYEAALKEGKTLAFVHTDEGRQDEANRMMMKSGAESVGSHRTKKQ